MSNQVGILPESQTNDSIATPPGQDKSHLLKYADNYDTVILVE